MLLIYLILTADHRAIFTSRMSPLPVLQGAFMCRAHEVGKAKFTYSTGVAITVVCTSAHEAGKRHQARATVSLSQGSHSLLCASLEDQTLGSFLRI